MFFHLTWSHRVSSALSRRFIFQFYRRENFLFCHRKKKLDKKILHLSNDEKLSKKNFLTAVNYDKLSNLRFFNLLETFFSHKYLLTSKKIFYHAMKIQRKKILINFFRFWFSNSQIKGERSEKVWKLSRKFIKVRLRDSSKKSLQWIMSD